MKLLCCSSTRASSLSFIFPDGLSKTYYKDTKLYVGIVYGCIRLQFYEKPSQFGVYTCNIFDNQRRRHSLNIGVYNEGYNGEW